MADYPAFLLAIPGFVAGVAAGGVGKWALGSWWQNRNRSTSEYRKQAHSVYDRVFTASNKVKKDADATTFEGKTMDASSWQDLKDACDDLPRVAPATLTKAAQDLPSFALIARMSSGSLRIAKSTQDVYSTTAKSLENAVAIVKGAGSEPDSDMIAEAASNRASAKESAEEVQKAYDGYIQDMARFERALTTFNDAAKKELGRPT